jgi:hypothetical protein
MKSHWAEYHGKNIFYVDLSNFAEDIKGFDMELKETITTIGQKVYEQPLKSVLILVDLRNTALTQTANDLLSNIIKDTKKYVRKTAVLGMTGVRKLFLDYFAMLASSDTAGFEELETAMQWLAGTA